MCTQKNNTLYNDGLHLEYIMLDCIWNILCWIASGIYYAGLQMEYIMLDCIWGLVRVETFIKCCNKFFLTNKIILDVTLAILFWTILLQKICMMLIFVAHQDENLSPLKTCPIWSYFFLFTDTNLRSLQSLWSSLQNLSSWHLFKEINNTPFSLIKLENEYLIHSSDLEQFSQLQNAKTS